MIKEAKPKARILICITLCVSLILASCFLVLGLTLSNNNNTAQGDALRFIVIGDWGREGSGNQSATAALLGKVAADFKPDFIVSTGDNFYPSGLTSTDDPLFERSFMNVYTAPSLQVPWHAVLGNHDYGDGTPYCGNNSASPCSRGPLSEIAIALTQRDNRWHCQRSFTEFYDNGRIQLFFIDTTPSNKTLHTLPVPDWPDYAGGVKTQSWKKQLAELEYKLAESKAEWKLVVGHHPPRSNGKSGNNKDLLEQVEPLLLKYGVRGYFGGHDHNLEHIYVQEIDMHYFISGSGSTISPFIAKNDSLYQQASNGFLAVMIEKTQLTADFYTLQNGTEAAYSALLHSNK